MPLSGPRPFLSARFRDTGVLKIPLGKLVLALRKLYLCNVTRNV